MDLEALGRDHGLLASLVGTEERGSTDVPGPGVLAGLGAEEPDIPQDLYQ